MIKVYLVTEHSGFHSETCGVFTTEMLATEYAITLTDSCEDLDTSYSVREWTVR